jgi:peptidoglycan/LPS O-acetylase OafA/YrhL
VHWPLIVFYSYWHLLKLSDRDRLIILAATFAVAVVMYYVVERPFRFPRKDGLWAKDNAFTAAAVAAAVLIVVPAYNAWTSGGWTGDILLPFSQ